MLLVCFGSGDASKEVAEDEAFEEASESVKCIEGALTGDSFALDIAEAGTGLEVTGAMLHVCSKFSE